MIACDRCSKPVEGGYMSRVRGVPAMVCADCYVEIAQAKGDKPPDTERTPGGRMAIPPAPMPPLPSSLPTKCYFCQARKADMREDGVRRCAGCAERWRKAV
jgi:hypothetical protein